MASTGDEVGKILLDFAPIYRVPTPGMSLRDPDTGLGYSDSGLALLASPLNVIVTRHHGARGVSAGELKASTVVADVRDLVDAKISPARKRKAGKTN